MRFFQEGVASHSSQVAESIPSKPLDTPTRQSSIEPITSLRPSKRNLRSASDIDPSVIYGLGSYSLPASPAQQITPPVQDVDMQDANSLPVQNSRGSNNLPNVVSREIAPFFQAIPPPVQDVGRKEGEIYTDSTIDFGSHSTSPSSLSSWGDHAPIVGSSATQVMDIRQDSVVIARSPPENSDAVGQIDVFKRKLRAHYIDNPNNHRDSLWLDTRRYPQDYYTDKPLSGPCYSGNARAVYAKASEQREKDYLNGIHQNSTVDSPDVDWIALRQLPALNYTFRSGAFVGKSLTGPRGVPEWYREELMCGGENWLVKTDVALGNEMKRRGYKVLKAQSVLNSRNSPSPATKRRVTFETSAPTTNPWVIPAQPTQSIVAAPLSPHDKVTLPSLPQILARDRRFDHAPMFPRHSGFWRTQREFASPNPVKDIDLDTVLIARNGPMAKFTDGAGSVDRNVDRDVLDKIWNAKRMGGSYDKKEVDD